MQKIRYLTLIISSISFTTLISCVTPGQRDAMRRDINSLDREVATIRNSLYAQSKQTEQNLKTNLSSQSEVQELQATIAENAGEIDALHAKLQSLEKIASASSSRYLEVIEKQKQEIDALNRKVAYLEIAIPVTEKPVQPSKKIQDSFQPQKLSDVNTALKHDFEKGLFKTVILKSSMVIQSKKSKADMIAAALEFRGEAKYKLADYSGAIIDLTNYIEKYPSGDKKARALLLLADSYVFLKQNASAKFYYDECSKHYEKTSTGKACAERSAKIKL